MTRYNVMPAAEREPYSWKVEANGRRTSTHKKQRTAIEAAKSRARSGDEVKVHDRHGRVRDSWTVR